MTMGLDEIGAWPATTREIRRAAIALLFFALGLAGCAADLRGRPGEPAAENTPYVGVFTGEYLDGKPLYRFPPIYVVGSRSGV
jgi:hypothetical protein